MFCENCGTKLEDGALFCENCGAKQEVPNVTPGFTPDSTITASVEGAPKVPLKEKLKKVPVYAWIIAAVVLVAVIVGGVFLYIKAHTIDVNDYLTVEFDGYDTMGKATVTIEEEFWEDLYEKASFKDKAKFEKEDYFGSYYTEADYMEEQLSKKIKYEIDPEGQLTNGDKVTVSWKIKTDSIKKKYGVTVKGEDKKFTVADLEEVESFNPFDDIEVSFAGLDGHGEANVEIVNEKDVYDDFTFSVSDNNYSLSTGDKVTVTFGAYYDEETLNQYCAENYGMVPTVVEQEYTVEGLGHYITNASELTETSLADVIEDAKVELEEDANLSEMETMNSMTYVGAYTLIGKEDSGNDTYLIFEMKVDLKDNESDGTDTVTYYAACEFTDVSINEEGVCAYVSNYGSLYNSFNYESSFGKKFYYYGYETLDDIKSDIEQDASWYTSYGYELQNTFGSDL